MLVAFFQKHKRWLIPIMMVAILTPFTPSIDLALARLFYTKTEGIGNGGHFVSNGLLDFFYNDGILFTDLTVLVAVCVLVLSYCLKTWKKWRRPALFLILQLVIGAGFITHVVLKDHWGRPRPKQVIEFGGKQQFAPYYSPNFYHQPEPSKSFSCGHCTMGFYFFAWVVLGNRLNNRALYWMGIALAFGLGIALSLTRMAQGGHFFSDTVISALIMWLTAVTLDWFLYESSGI